MENSRTRAKTHDALLAGLRDALDAIGCDLPKPLAVAFSGGMDSTVLLHVAHLVAKERGAALLAFHINHGLSPNAPSWAAHCVKVCAMLGLACEVVDVRLPARASIEAAAREARYEALLELCGLHGVGALLTAHHAEDQAETVLLNVLRGTGIPGLRGISAQLSVGDEPRWLVRPWLGVSQAKIESYARQHKLHWIDDESNADPKYRRNALRHGALKSLKAQNPHIVARLGALARHAAAADHLLDDLAVIDLGQSTDKSALELEALAPLNLQRRANLLRFWLKTAGYGVPDEARLSDWLRQIESASTALRLSSGQDTFIIRDGALRPATAQDGYQAPRDPVCLAWSTSMVLEVPAWRGRLHADATEEHGIALSKLRREGVELRSRIGGERLKLSGDQPSRTLKNLYQEAQIDAVRRAVLPLVYCKEQLIFAAGLGMNVKACSLASADRVTLRWEADPSEH